MHRYVHVTVPTSAIFPRDPATLVAPANEVAADWIRYTPTTLILWTNRNLPEIADAFRRHLESGATVLVQALGNEIPSGFMPSWVWEWINRYRDRETGYVNFPPPPPPPAPPLFTPPAPPVNLLGAPGSEEANPFWQALMGSKDGKK